MRQVRRVAWYRFRATFARRWGGYLSVVLLIGLIGGTAMASIEAARRTQSSYPTFLASTNPSDLTVSIFAPGSGAATTSLLSGIAHLSDVKRVRAIEAPDFIPLAPDGAPRLGTLGDVAVLDSLDGAFYDQDRPAVAQGRTANPDRADEMVMTATAASVLGAHVGQVVPMGFYTTAQEDLPNFGAPGVAPRLLANVRLVGIVVFNNSVVQDDIDRAYGFVMLSPALLAEAVAVAPAAGAPIGYSLQLRHGANDVPAVEEQVLHLVPPGSVPQFHVTSRVVSEVELALKPESVALGGFGAIAALVCLVLGAQAISRQLRLVDGDRAVMRALGAGPAETVGDGLIGALGAILLGALLAVAVAVALSPLSPLGPVRPFYPDGGIAFDWTVLGLGLVVLVTLLGAGAVLLCYRRAPHRTGGARPAAARTSSTARRAEAAGMPVAAVAGVRFALEPGQGRTAVPVRSALVGTVIAVAMVVATLTFASSLHTLVSHPALYGWNWDYTLNPSNDVPPAAMRLLDHDPDVAAWSGFDYNNTEIDDQTVPVLMARSAAEAVSPPILSGHGLEAADQVVIGAATLAVLHKHIGNKVFLSYGSLADAPLYVPPTPMVIVGTATFPAVGYESLVADHTSMGTGAMFSEAIFPPAFQRAVGSQDPNLNGPELVFVRMRRGVSAAAGRADMQRIADAGNRVFANDHSPRAQDNNVVVLGVQRPAQIVNYRTIGSTPVVLAIGLAAGATGALGLTLAASVRRRRRDLALLKALGFTQGQLAAAVAWQATVAAAIGVVVGIPLGAVMGRQLWILFANNLNAVPDATVPALSVVLVAVGAFVFANLVAALPGRGAARTPTALVLRAE
jgi:hypothetical protein